MYIYVTGHSIYDLLYICAHPSFKEDTSCILYIVWSEFDSLTFEALLTSIAFNIYTYIYIYILVYI